MAVSSSILSVISGSGRNAEKDLDGKPVKFAHKITGASHRVFGDCLGEWSRRRVTACIYRTHLLVKITDILVAFLLALLLLVLSQLRPQQLKLARVSGAGWRLRWPTV
jgi:hypothetical protein